MKCLSMLSGVTLIDHTINNNARKQCNSRYILTGRADYSVLKWFRDMMIEKKKT